MSYFWTAMTSAVFVLAHALQRRAQIPGAGRGRVVGVVWKDVEQVTSEDPVALGHRGAEIRVAGGNDLELRCKDEIEAGC